VAAEVVSSVGSSMMVLALPWFVLVATGSATKLGLVLGIGSIPFVTLPLPAGLVIARIGARQTMVIADAARLPLLAVIPAIYNLDALSFPLLVVLVALANVCMAAHMPAQRLVLAEVVGDEESLVARVNAHLHGGQRLRFSSDP
jgi:MFS family permease